jgi:hypothetical protein
MDVGVDRHNLAGPRAFEDGNDQSTNGGSARSVRLGNLTNSAKAPPVCGNRAALPS